MIYLGTDHAGFELKEKIKTYLFKHDLEFKDFGAFEFNENDDYPDYISQVAEAVSKDPDNSKGIILGGSGQGEAIVANKYPGVRAVVFYTPFPPNGSDDKFKMIKYTREHNDANILSLGARFLTEEDTLEAVQLWLETPYSGEDRHARRLEKIKQIEKH